MQLTKTTLELATFNAKETAQVTAKTLSQVGSMFQKINANQL